MVIVTQGLSVVQLFTVTDVKKKEKRTNFKSVLDAGSKIKPSAETAWQNHRSFGLCVQRNYQLSHSST